jgi:hypothetical protein
MDEALTCSVRYESWSFDSPAHSKAFCTNELRDLCRGEEYAYCYCDTLSFSYSCRDFPSSIILL